MASTSSESITEACANLLLADLDDDESATHGPMVAVRQEVEELRYCVVGRLVTDRPIKFAYFRDTMASVWRPWMGVTFSEIQPRFYLIRFFHEADINRILDDGPWSYEQNLLVMRRLKEGETTETVQLSHTEFWI